jgi:tetratricopeptide (TPR) repeat protein
VGDRAANLQQAIACYEQALRFRTPEADPDGCRRAARGLGDLYFGDCQWSQAKASYTTAIKATDVLYKVAATEVSRQAELAETGDLFSNSAFCLAQLGKFDEAVEQLEAGKARGLAEALARDRAALDGVRPEARAAFDAALLAKNAGDTAEFSRQVEQCRMALDRTNRLAGDVARQMTAYADIPTERYLLFRYNQNVLASLESDREYLAQVLAFHKSPAR